MGGGGGQVCEGNKGEWRGLQGCREMEGVCRGCKAASAARVGLAWLLRSGVPGAEGAEAAAASLGSLPSDISSVRVRGGT